MLRIFIAGLIVNCATMAAAGHSGDRGGGVDLRGLWFGHRGSFGDLGGLGFGFGFGLGGLNDIERTQERFEARFDDLMMDYEEGVAEIDDFYTTDEYDDIADDTERLVDRYDRFVTGVETKIERLTDIIGIANESLMFFEDLLADYQADEDLPPARLERIEDFITRITDRIDSGIDRLTEKQTTLQGNVATFLDFQTDLTTFLDDIVTAGETTSGTTAALAVMAASPRLGAALPVFAQLESSAALTGSSGSAVPEPSTLLSLLLLSGLVAVGMRRRPELALAVNPTRSRVAARAQR
jgi:hypothetical protein